MMQRTLTGLALTAAMAAASTAAFAAAKPDIRIDDVHVYPESVSATPDGTVYVGSAKGVVFRAPPGARFAEPWILPTPDNGVLALLGVLAQPNTRTLWLCSAPSPFSRPPAKGVSSLMAFDLRTRAPKGAYPFPAPASTCNDITVGKDGAVYATDTPNGRILVLKPGAKQLELFAADDRLKGIDGIVFGKDGTLYLNIVSRGQLMRVDRGADGVFTGLTELKLSQPVAGPDGFRLISGSRFLLAEGNSGKVDVVEIKGDEAKITVLKEGLTSPPGVTAVGKTAYAIEGKVGYLIDPRLKGQEPGPFIIHAIPLP